MFRKRAEYPKSKYVKVEIEIKQKTDRVTKIERVDIIIDYEIKNKFIT